MKVIVKRPNKPIEIVDIDCKYRNEVSKLIGDNIINEYVHIKTNELTLVVDELGMVKELPLNFMLETTSLHYPIQMIVGTAVFCRYQYENPWEKEIWDYELMDITEEDIQIVNKILENRNQLFLTQEFMKNFQ